MASKGPVVLETVAAFNVLVNKVMIKSNAHETQKRWLTCANWALRLIARYAILSDENTAEMYPMPRGNRDAFRDQDEDVWAEVTALANIWQETYGNRREANWTMSASTSSRTRNGVTFKSFLSGANPPRQLGANMAHRIWNDDWAVSHNYPKPIPGIFCHDCNIRGFITRNCPCKHGWRMVNGVAERPPHPKRSSSSSGQGRRTKKPRSDAKPPSGSDSESTH
jgi:hypothetical protein